MSRDDLKELCHALDDRALDVARALFPNGARQGPEFYIGSLAGEKGQSLAVRVSGDKRGVWRDFAAGEGGDILDLVAGALFSGDKKQACAWARNFLGQACHDRHGVQAALPKRPPPKKDEPDAEELALRARARAIWLAARENILETPVELYLANRAINLRKLGRAPRCLRFEPLLWCGESGIKLPALVAAITAPDGSIAGVHRTWLTKDAAGRWIKANVPHPKKSMGRYVGGCIRLWRGAAGVPMNAAPPGSRIVVCEGIEDGLSIAIGLPEERVVVAVSLSNMTALMLPPQFTEVVIAADNDGDNPAAQRNLQRAIDRFIGEGRRVKLARSPIGKDFNDCLRADRMEAA